MHRPAQRGQHGREEDSSSNAVGGLGRHGSRGCPVHASKEAFGQTVLLVVAASGLWPRAPTARQPPLLTPACSSVPQCLPGQLPLAIFGCGSVPCPTRSCLGGRYKLRRTAAAGGCTRHVQPSTITQHIHTGSGVGLMKAARRLHCCCGRVIIPAFYSQAAAWRAVTPDARPPPLGRTSCQLKCRCPLTAAADPWRCFEPLRSPAPRCPAAAVQARPPPPPLGARPSPAGSVGAVTVDCRRQPAAAAPPLAHCCCRTAAAPQAVKLSSRTPS